jgi:hypothetical protein
MKFLLVITLFFTSCASMSEQQWKQKKMIKADRKMIKKVWRIRRLAK